MSSESGGGNKLQQLRQAHKQKLEAAEKTLTHSVPVLQEQRAQTIKLAKKGSGVAFQGVMAELQSKRLQLNRLSATRSAGDNSVRDHNKYVSTLLDGSGKQGLTHNEFAQKRYGDSGTERLQTLEKLGSGMEDLITDPALMSTTHLDAFADFAGKTAQSRSQGQMAPLSAWEMRDAYESSLPKGDWYRGLKLDTQVGRNLSKTGIDSRVHRSLNEIQANAKKSSGRGVINQLINPKAGDTLPNLDESFDKDIHDVVMQRVNKQERGKDVPQIEKMRKSDFVKTLPAWKDLDSSEKALHSSPRAYQTKKYAEYSDDVFNKRKARGKRVDDEAVTQSITKIPEVGIGFGGSDLFGGGIPNESERVFNYKMQLSPLEHLAPQDWVPENAMSTGVKVNDKSIPNSSSLESITLGKMSARNITSTAEHSAETIPKFSALE